MRAIRVHHFGEPSVLRVEEVADPVAGEGQLVVKVAAVGVNPVETYIRSGIYGSRTFPYTPGADAAGVVESVGAGVTGLRVGDRVWTSGTLSGSYAEKALVSEAQAHRLPERASFAQGAALGVPYTTAWVALFDRGAARPAETVLIHGASGGVGLAAVQMARAHGMVVIGTGGSDEGRKLVAAEGADHVLDHASPDYLDNVMKITGGRGVDLIVEMAAHINLGRDLGVLARRGRVVVVGSRGQVEVTPRDLMSRNADVRGMSLLTVSPDELRAPHAAIVAGLEAGTLRPIIDIELPLAEAPRAHEEVMRGGSRGKIVLVP